MPPIITLSETTFASLQLCEPLQRALADKNYTHPSPIQAQAIPLLLKGGDLIGCAQTGTGKTAAFALPILHRLSADPRPAGARRVRALILTPTRELAAQIGESFRAYGRHLNLTHTVIFGGVGQHPQVRALSRGIDILIATPGRLLDLHQQGHVKLDAVEVFVLDEADRMLDLGFINDVKYVLSKLPPQSKRQSLLFSATMPPAIQALVNQILNNPAKVEVAPAATTAERIEQHLCYVERNDKHKLLVHLLEKHTEGLVLVFVRMKHSANRLVENLSRDGIRADAIHGNKSQGARQRALENFRSGRCRILVATDIAARGIDVKGVSLVVNFDLPEEPESYVHRIGRTARAGADGLAIAFCDRAERPLLRDIERIIRKSIPVLRDHPFAKAEPSPSEMAHSASPRQGGRSFSPRGNGGGGRPQRFQGNGQGRPPRSQGNRSGSQSSQGQRSNQPQGSSQGAAPSQGGSTGRRFFGFRRASAPTGRN